MKLKKIKEKLSAILLQFSTIKTDKAVLEYDETELAVGINVFITDENGERVTAENGDYTTEEGVIITVVDGKIDEIKEPTEEEPVEEPKEEDVVAEEPVVEEPKEEEPVEEEPKDETIEKINELTTKVEELTEIVNKIVEQMKDYNAVEERLSKVEKMSAANSVEKAFETTTSSTPKTGNSKLDKQLERVKEMNKNWREI